MKQDKILYKRTSNQNGILKIVKIHNNPKSKLVEKIWEKYKCSCIIFIQQKMTRTFFQIIWILMNNVLLKNSIYFNQNTYCLLIRQCFYLDYGFADEDVMEDQIYVLLEEWITYLPFQRRVLTTRRQSTWKVRGQNDYCNKGK